MDLEDIRRAINAASDGHALQRGGRAYSDGFISAFCAVYPESLRAKTLQAKFFLPNETGFSDQAFYQSASELTVANHIRQQQVSDFAVDKRVNATGKKDVDVWCRVRSTEVAIEVKCPVQPRTDLSGIDTRGGIVMEIRTAGRIPDHQRQLHDFKRQVESGRAGSVVIGKNKDLALKDALVSAHGKFSSNSSVDNVNVLFLSGGYVDNLNQYYMNLYAPEGFFTCAPLHPAPEFQLVDVVVLSNLRNWHEQSAATHDWSLRDVFLLPLVNSHHRPSLMSQTLIEGLSVFDHHMHRFNEYVDTASGDFPSNVREPLRLLHYINDDLSETELKRYFPVQPHPLGKAARAARWPATQALADSDL